MRPSSRLLKNVLERSGCARLIQHSGPWRTKDSAPRGPGFENCASLIPSRVFQQPANAVRTVWNAGAIDTSHLGFRPIQKIATIHASSRFIRGIPI